MVSKGRMVLYFPMVIPVSSAWMNKDKMPFGERIERIFLVPKGDSNIYGTCAGSKASTLTMYLSVI